MNDKFKDAVSQIRDNIDMTSIKKQREIGNFSLPMEYLEEIMASVKESFNEHSSDLKSKFLKKI